MVYSSEIEDGYTVRSIVTPSYIYLCLLTIICFLPQRFFKKKGGGGGGFPAMIRKGGRDLCLTQTRIVS